MIQNDVLRCPACSRVLLDPIYDLGLGDGGIRRMTCGGCGRPFTLSARLVYDVSAGDGPAPLADAVLAAFRYEDGGPLAVGGRGRLVKDGKPSDLTFGIVVDERTGLPYMAVADKGGGTAKASILGLWMRGWRFAKED